MGESKVAKLPTPRSRRANRRELSPLRFPTTGNARERKSLRTRIHQEAEEEVPSWEILFYGNK